MFQLMQSIAQDDAKFAKTMVGLGLAFAATLIAAMTVIAKI